MSVSNSSLKSLQIILSLLMILSAKPSAQAALSNTGWDLNAEANEIKVMSYNVENLFDAEHDAGKLDGDYLPFGHPLKQGLCYQQYGSSEKQFTKCMESNWTGQHVNMKLIQIEKIIRAQGSLPDVVGLVEVENTKVMSELARRMGYQFVMYEGPDERGIDVALMFKSEKLRLLRARPISVSQYLGNGTRDILEVQFAFRGGASNQVLTFFVNHWPSPLSPYQKRMVAAQVLKKSIADVRASQPKTEFFIFAMGDFNVVDTETPSAVYASLLIPSMQLFDLQKVSDRSNNPLNSQMPPGTHFNYFDRTWNHLDKMILSQNFGDGRLPEVVPQTFRIFGPPGVAKYDAWVNQYIPQKYRTYIMNDLESGYSDHFPISTIIRLY